MPGYRCIKCNKKYYSKKIFDSKQCRYCKGKIVRNNKRKIEKPRRTEINMDLMIFRRRKRKGVKRVDLKDIFALEMDIEVKEDLTDPDWEPGARDFWTKSRCTGASMPVSSLYSTRKIDHTATKKKASLVKGRAGRKGPNSIMGKAILGTGTISANQLVANKKWSFLKPWTNFEWCHLVGDCLGGPTESNNLVAASYSANTYMAAMEMIIAGHTELSVKVAAYCSTLHVAEYITYNVLKKGKSLFYREIDAKILYFSTTDFDSVQNDLKQAI